MKMSAITKKRRFAPPGATPVILLVFACILSACTRPPREITWERDYEKAVERSSAENKIIIADMFTDWCVLCKDMDNETFANPGLIAEMARKYVWLKLNTETEEDGKKLQADLGITSYPTILVLDSKGREIDRINQFLKPDPFKLAVEAALQDPESLGKARERAEADPKSVELRSIFGNKLLDRKNYRHAEAEFRQIIEIDPENKGGKTVEGYYNLALSLASQTRFPEALDQLALLEEKFPNAEEVPNAHMLRGQIYECCGEKDKAIIAFREYLKKYPNHNLADQVRQILSAMGESE